MSSSLSPDQRKELIRHHLEMTWNEQKSEGRIDIAPTDISLARSQQHGSIRPDPLIPCTSSWHTSPAAPTPTSLLQLRQAVRHAFPDLQLTITNLISEEDTLVARWQIQGTDLGGYEGYLPTGKVVCLTGITIVRLEDLRITEEWNEIDVMGMLNQLGVVSFSPSPRITIRRPRLNSLSAPASTPPTIDERSNEKEHS